MLTKLPNELLFEIIGYINNADINTLCQIAEVKAIIDRYLCVVVDNPTSRKFTAISKSFDFREVDNASNFKDVEKVIVEDHEGYYLPTYLSHAHIKSCSISVFADEIGEDEYDAFADLQGPGISSLRLETATVITLDNTIIPLHVIDMPSVTEMALTDCKFSSHGKLRAPKLQTLTVTGVFASINAGLDYETTPLRNLYIYDCFDMERWENITCPTLQLVSSEDSSLGVVRNLTFDKLKTLDIVGSVLREITDLKLPSAEMVMLETTEQLSMERLEAAELKKFEIYAESIGHFHDWNTSLTHACFALSRNIREHVFDIDADILRGLESLTIGSASQSLLQHTPKLKVLDIADINFSSKESYNLPLLRKLTVRYGGEEHIPHLPRDILKNLHEIVFMSHNMNPSYDSLKANVCPNLEIMRITANRDSISLNNLSCSGLKTLGLDSPFEGTSVSNCTFPDLICFESTYSAFFFDKNSHFDFIAPHLKNLSIKYHTIHHLDLRGFEHLENVLIKGSVGNITFGKCSSIKTLEISKNNSLLHFSAGVFKALKVFNCKETPFFQSGFELKAPLLKKKTDEEGVVIYVPGDDLQESTTNEQDHD